MTNRKKRLKKSIISIQKAIELHEEKKRLAEEAGQKELVSYFTKEIKGLEEQKTDKKEKLDK